MGDTNSQLRVLVVTSDPFWQHHRGSSQRIRTMLDYLITFCDVTICFIGELTIREWTEATAILPCQIVGPGEPGKVAASIVGTAAKWLSNHEARKGDEPIQSEPVSLEVFESELIANYVAELAKDNFDWVLLEYVTLSYLCPAIRDVNVGTMIDTHDAMSIRCDEFKRLGLQSWLDIDVQSEIIALDRADVVLAIQPVEQEYFESHGLKGKVVLATHAAEFSGSAKSADEPFTLGFVGSRGEANVSDLCYWLSHGWPKVREGLPGVRLLIAGSISREDIPSNHLEGVEFIGRVPFLADFYSKISVAINPAQFASGMKIKSLEAIAHGVPLITTAAGSAGLESAAEQGCMKVCEDPDSFGSAIVELAEDQNQLRKMANQCRGVVESTFGPDQVFRALKNRLMSKRDGS